MAEAATIQLPPLGELRPGDYMRLARQLVAGNDLAPLRIAVLGSATLQFLESFLIVEGARRGHAVKLYFGEFNQLEQELSPASGRLGEFQPDLLLLMFRPEDIDPDAIVRFHRTGGKAYRQLCAELTGRLSDGVATFRATSAASVLVANFVGTDQEPFGLFEANAAPSYRVALAEVNHLLQQSVTRHPGAAIWDLAGLAAQRGLSRWSDLRLAALFRIPVAAEHHAVMAEHLVRSYVAMTRPPAKCLVLDLDNTMWGGVIGDDGLDGIQLSDDFPGSAFKRFQRTVLSLTDRGVLLAVASKNEADVVEQAFREHPDMLVTWDDLAATRVNWGPKSQSIRQLAEELNLGADAFVFFDDNPVERAEVRSNAPEVRVIEVPTDPLEYSRALLDSGHFDHLMLTAEDRNRGVMYREERKRSLFATQFQSVDDFLTGLEMVAQVGSAGPATLGRIAQLVGKTNQFNLTTRRHSAADLARMSTDPAWRLVWLRLRDRFGDHGLVAIGILNRTGDRATIDSIVMSCRVMGRQVERALLSYLVEEAAAAGVRTLVGEYFPTRKNGSVKTFYPGLGFSPVPAEAPGSERYQLAIGSSGLDWPAVVGREDDKGASQTPGAEGAA